MTELHFFKVSPTTFSFQIPPWINERFSADITRIEALKKQYGMYENNLTSKIADIYSDIVLFNKVDSIKRTFPNKLNIKLVLRKPAAIIKSKNTTYLVDDECVLLPKEYYPLSNTDYEYPYIQSNKLDRLPLYGNKWHDKRIKAGVELIKFLRANNIHNLFKILAVDVTNVCKRRTKDKSDIILWTENNTQIRWGCSSLYKEPNELSDEEKLQNLLSIAKTEGTTLKKMEYVDVRWKKPVGKQWTKINDISGKN
jgi:cell division septal protein FtsQ